MGLDENGFNFVPKADIEADQIQKLQHYFSTDIDTSPGSFFGKLVRYETENIYNVQQKLLDNYDAANVYTATGVQLDRLAASIGIHRNLATRAEANVVIVGRAGYVVAEGTEFGTDNADYFTTENEIQLDNVKDFEQNYWPQIKKNNPDDAEDIGNIINQTVNAIGTDDSIDPKERQQAINNIGIGYVTVLSRTAAAYENVDAGTIDNVTEPVDEISSVYNPQPAQGGADIETDYELRNRVLQNLKSSAGPTPEGLQTALTNLPGVINVTRQVNTSDNTDNHGNPPHSIHFFVSGGNQNDIFNTLATTAADGTTFVGNNQKTVMVDNSPVVVRYDDAAPLNLTFNISLDSSDGYSEDAVRESVDDFVNSFQMGSKIILNKLYMNLYELDGIDNVTSLSASDGKNTYSGNDAQIQLGSNQVGQINDLDKDIKITATPSKGQVNDND